MPITTKVITVASLASLVTAGTIYTQIDNINELLNQFSTKNPHLAWSQEILSDKDIKDYQFGLSDSTSPNNIIVLPVVDCKIFTPDNYNCEAELPPMTPGSHVLSLRSKLLTSPLWSTPSNTTEYRFNAVVKP